MKKKYFSKTLKMILFLTLIFTSLRSFSQTVLTEGDIAFTRINIDDESFSFVLLVPITNSTEFIITDEAWDGSTLLAFESSIQFTATSTFLAGEEISISSSSLSFSSSGSGTATLTSVGSFNPIDGNMLGAAGDNLFIYQSAGAPGSNDFVTGINANGGVIGSPGNAWSTTTSSSNSLLPSGLTNGTNALGIFPNGGAQTEVDNARYKATALRTGDKATVLAAIMDLTNWEYDNDVVQAPVGTSFIITGGNTAPVIGDTAAGQVVNDNATISPFSGITITDVDGDNVSATITLDDNAKGILAGTGIAGSGPYTLASTSTANLQSLLRALIYNPTDNRTATSETTTFTVVVNDGTDDAIDNTTTVISNAVSPTITSVNVPTNATYTTGQNLNFIVNFNESVTVNTTGGTPQLSITIGSTVRQAVYISGSGSTGILFRYTIQSGDLDTDGITTGTLVSNGGTLRDSGGASANLTLNSVGNTSGVLVDAVAPTVTNIVRQNPTTSPTNADALTWDVTFNESVSNVDATDFSVSGTTATITGVTNPSGNTYRITTSGGDLANLNGTVTLSFAGGQNIADSAGNALTNTTPTGTNNNSFVLDNTAPSITNVAVPNNGTYTAGQNLDFNITFDKNVNVFTTGGTPQLSINIGGNTRQAVYVIGTGNSVIGFRYVVQTGDNDTDGITVGTLDFNGGSIADALGNNADPTLNNVGDTSSVLVDTEAPSGYSVVIDQSIINTTNESAVSFTFADAEVGANYSYSFSSSGGAGTVDGSGNIATATDQITGINLSTLNDGTITLSVTLQDAVGNTGSAATDTAIKDASAPSGYTVVIDQSVINSTNSSSVSFTFTAAEIGTLYSYSFTSSGGAGSVNGSGTINTATDQISGIDLSSLNDGTITLSVTLEDNAGNTGLATTDTEIKDTSIPMYTILPTVTSPTNANPIPFTVTFTEAVTGFDESDLNISNGTVSNFTGSGANYSFDAIPTINEGQITVNVIPTGVFDLNGNENSSSGSLGILYDGVRPSVTISSSENSPTGANPIPVVITFDEAVSDFELNDIIVSNGTVSDLSPLVTNTVFSVNITPISSGTITIDINANIAFDNVSNGNFAANQFSIESDITRPSVVISSPESSPTGVNPIPITITFDEDVINFDLADISVANGSATNLTGSGAVYSAEIIPTITSGNISVLIDENRVSDIVFNGNLFSNVFVIEYDSTLSVADELLSQGLRLYPNPNSGKLYVSADISLSVKTIQVFDITGKRIFTKNLDNLNPVNEVQLSTLNAGVYMIKITSDTATALKKLVIE